MQKIDKFEKKIIPPRLKEVRAQFSLNQSDLADLLGVKQNYFSRYENGVSEFSDDLKIKLIEVIQKIYNKRINIDWLLSGEGEMFLESQEKEPENNRRQGTNRLPVYNESELPEGAFVVPLLDQNLSAGVGSSLPEEDEIMALVRVPSYLSRYGKNILTLTVDGESMYPTLHRGDLVVCDSCGWSGEGIYAVQMSGSGFVKRVTKKPGKIVIISDNPKYPTQEEPEESEDIRIVGRVHCAIVRLE